MFIKLENEHPFSKPRVDTSLTARLQAEYEKRFGSLTPRRPRKFSLKKTKWDMLSEGDSRDQESKSIYDDPLPFNCQSIKEQFERQQKGGRRTQRKSLSNFRYDSMNYVDGQYRDAHAKEGEAWNPRVHQAWGQNSRGSKVQRQRFGRGQRKYQHICLSGGVILDIRDIFTVYLSFQDRRGSFKTLSLKPLYKDQNLMY